MDLNKISMRLRPRGPYETIDLGFPHGPGPIGKKLYKIWFVITLPLMLILLVAFYPGNLIWAALIFWWLKPLLERPLLHYLSRILFGSDMSLSETLLTSVKPTFRQVFSTLTFRRLSFTRSFDAPIVQLEELKGTRRSQAHTNSALTGNWCFGLAHHGFVFYGVSRCPPLR